MITFYTPFAAGLKFFLFTLYQGQRNIYTWTSFSVLNIGDGTKLNSMHPDMDKNSETNEQFQKS